MQTTPHTLLISLCLGFSLFLTGCREAPETRKAGSPDETGNTFQNPLLNSGPDPWVIRRDSFYYYCHTMGDHIRLWKTTAMSRLKSAPSVTVWTPPGTGPNSRNIWAPELHYLAGKWYLYYTAGASADLSTQRTWVLENASADPTKGTWTDKGQIWHPSENFWAIDGTVLQLNGKAYFIWSGHRNATDNTQRIYISLMADPWTLTGPRVQLSEPELSWEKLGDPDVNEGPEILQRNGKVFLVYSASGCWTDDYSLGMLTMDEKSDPLKPESWTKSSLPVFVRASEAGVYGPGHNGFFQSPDGTEDWIIYHANPRPGLGCSDLRSPRMQSFTWKADGTPDFGRPVPVSTPVPRPSGE